MFEIFILISLFKLMFITHCKKKIRKKKNKEKRKETSVDFIEKELLSGAL